MLWQWWPGCLRVSHDAAGSWGDYWCVAFYWMWLWCVTAPFINIQKNQIAPISNVPTLRRLGGWGGTGSTFPATFLHYVFCDLLRKETLYIGWVFWTDRTFWGLSVELGTFNRELSCAVFSSLCGFTAETQLHWASTHRNAKNYFIVNAFNATYQQVTWVESFFCACTDHWGSRQKK